MRKGCRAGFWCLFQNARSPNHPAATLWLWTVAAPLAASRQRTRCRDRPQPQRSSRMLRAPYILEKAPQASPVPLPPASPPSNPLNLLHQIPIINHNRLNQPLQPFKQPSILLSFLPDKLLSQITHPAFKRLLIKHSKSFVFAVRHIRFVCEQRKLILIRRACIWAEALAVAALVAHIVYMDDLCHIHSRYLHCDVGAVWTDVYAVFADGGTAKAPVCFRFAAWFF